MQDDIIPLSKPIVTTNGQTVDSLFIAKGTPITVPIACINTLESFWGPDAKEFKPERWLDQDRLPKELKSYRHIFTFSDGPRLCLGKPFALAEFKVCTVCFVSD
jgi:cytochrome P450